MEEQPITPDAAQIAARVIEQQLKSTPSPKSTLFDEKKLRAFLPPEMLSEKRFVRFFLQPKAGGGTAKIPLGNHSDSSTWSTFDDAVRALENDQQGVGYNFLGGEVQGLDIDHCRNPKTGVICNEAMLLLSRLGSLAEYSVSGQGIHVFFIGNVRGKQLNETCIQLWNSKSAPRFFALTGNGVGEAFADLKDVGDDFNYVFATAKHISAKIREELKTVDPDQWAALPAEREPVEPVTREKSKTKTRKVVKDFDIKDFLQFYNIPIDNECDNEIGHCIRVATCPLKGEPHVGHNSTTCNFIYPTKDGGLAFHCQSTGCVDYGISEALKKLAEGERGKYPKPIYEERTKANTEDGRFGCTQQASEIKKEHRVWLWPGYLGRNKVAHFGGGSTEGKSPVTLDLSARVSAGLPWPDGQPNQLGPMSVIILAAEDDWADTIIPRLDLSGANLSKIHRFFVTQKSVEITPNIEDDCHRLEEQIRTIGDVGLVIIDPITNYLGSRKMNAEEEIRSGILMPLSLVAGQNDCAIVTVGHLNKRGNDAALLQRLMGCAAFGGVMRDVFMFGNDPDEEDVYAHVMAEIRNKSAPKLKYKTEAVKVEWDGKTSEVIRVKWCGVSRADTDEVVNAPKQQDKSITNRAVGIVSGMLRSGAKKKSDLDLALKDNGLDVSKLDFHRLKKKCKAEARPLPGKGAGWEWYLPTPEQTEFDRPNTEERLTA
jgi:RecA-family ATPase